MKHKLKEKKKKVSLQIVQINHSKVFLSKGSNSQMISITNNGAIFT